MSKVLTAAMDNVHAWRLADAAREAMSPTQKVGDPIDRGLILLRLLNEKGFDVIVRETQADKFDRTQRNSLT